MTACVHLPFRLSDLLLDPEGPSAPFSTSPTPPPVTDHRRSRSDARARRVSSFIVAHTRAGVRARAVLIVGVTVAGFFFFFILLDFFFFNGCVNTGNARDFTAAEWIWTDGRAGSTMHFVYYNDGFFFFLEIVFSKTFQSNSDTEI